VITRRELDQLRSEWSLDIGVIEKDYVLGWLLAGVAALGTLSTRAVVERRRQIGVLRALGFSASAVSAGLLVESAVVALLGAALGVGVGLFVADNTVTFLSRLNPELQFSIPWDQVLLVVLVALAAALLMTVLPARQAARLTPAEALPQLSQHFFQQAEEEKGHALRFIKYVVDAGGRVVIPAIDAPKSKFKTARDAVKLSLDQEIHVTQQINGLVGLARKQNDYITINFLQWFLTEQLEEVSSMDNLLKIIERAGTDLLQADEYLARVGIRTMPEPPKQ